MSDFNRKTFVLTIRIPDPDILVSVLDGYGKTIAKSITVEEQASDNDRDLLDGLFHNDIRLDLPEGVYQVRSEKAGLTERKHLRLCENTQVDAPVPPGYSTVPLAGMATTDQHFTAAVERLSNEGCVAQNPQPNLVVFLRTIEIGAEDIGHVKMELKQADGALIPKTSNEINYIKEDDYMGFAGSIEPGWYSLTFDDSKKNEDGKKRSLPIWTTDRFQIQVFALVHNGKIQYNSLRILYAHREHGFNPKDSSLRSTEIVISALASGAKKVSASSLNYALVGKFDNPALGVLGAHYILRTGNRRGILTTVTDNLESLLGNKCPDVIALKSAIKDIPHYRRSETAVYPPMFQASYQLLIDASTEYDSPVRMTELTEDIGIGLHTDSPFVTWDPDAIEDQETGLEWIQQSLQDSLFKPETLIDPENLETISRTLGLTNNVIRKAAIGALKNKQKAAENIGDAEINLMRALNIKNDDLENKPLNFRNEDREN